MVNYDEGLKRLAETFLSILLWIGAWSVCDTLVDHYVKQWKIKVAIYTAMFFIALIILIAVYPYIL